ncbi:50S ribosomal protein L24 [Candidatus Beckwithbacteria bacterium]|nr:50S ribosomal protein L24 [Candidatus Beckwithbacteria bacterium]
MTNLKTKIKVGDQIEVIKGKDLGKKGQVEKILREKSRILVKNINLVKKHIKARKGVQGGIISVERPLSIANVQLLCPNCQKRTRIGIEGEGKNKQRICKKCKAPLASKTEVKNK